MKKLVKDVEGFPPEKPTDKSQIGSIGRNLGFNEARDLIGNLQQELEALDEKEVAQWFYEEGDVWRLHRFDLAKKFCSHFGTSAVGAGKQGYPLKQHWGDCTFYASMLNGNPTDGICTCGYGLQEAHDNQNFEQLCSKERLKASLSTSLGTSAVWTGKKELGERINLIKDYLRDREKKDGTKGCDSLDVVAEIDYSDIVNIATILSPFRICY